MASSPPPPLSRPLPSGFGRAQFGIGPPAFTPETGLLRVEGYSGSKLWVEIDGGYMTSLADRHVGGGLWAAVGHWYSPGAPRRLRSTRLPISSASRSRCASARATSRSWPRRASASPRARSPSGRFSIAGQLRVGSAGERRLLALSPLCLGELPLGRHRASRRRRPALTTSAASTSRWERSSMTVEARLLLLASALAVGLLGCDAAVSARALDRICATDLPGERPASPRACSSSAARPATPSVSTSRTAPS